MGGSNGFLEEDWEIVDDSIAAADLLHQLRTSTEHHSSEMLSLAVGEKRPHGRLLATLVRCCDGIQDQRLLEKRLGVGDGQATKSTNDVQAFLMSVLRDEPTWRFG